MNLRYIDCFIQVVECGSIAGAARHMGLPAATVAQRLKALEQDMGCLLLQRSGRAVIPTLAGNRILSHARTLLAAERTLRAAATNSELPPGPLRLGATPTALTGILPDALKTWKNLYPDIPVLIEPDVTPILSARLLAGELDIAIMAHPQHPLPKIVRWLALSKEPLVMIAPTGLSTPDITHTLETEDFILYDRRTVAGKMVESYLKRIRIQPKVRLELDGIVPISELVSAGLGISVVPGSPSLRRQSGLRSWPLPPPCPQRTLGAVWLRTSPRLRLAEALINILEIEGTKQNAGHPLNRTAVTD